MPHRIALGLFALLFAATWIDPRWPVEQAVHHSLTAVALVAIVWADQRRRLPFSSLVLILVFLALHTVAARWIYSYVPYDEWSRALFGVRVSDVFGWQRNHFDRLVHIAYGVCLAPVLYTFFAGRLGWRRMWAAVAAVNVIVSTGAVYEILEWGIAVGLAPEYAEAYNGQQGDVFDAQKDMALAAAGAVVAVVVAAVVAIARRPGRSSSTPPPDQR